MVTSALSPVLPLPLTSFIELSIKRLLHSKNLLRLKEYPGSRRLKKKEKAFHSFSVSENEALVRPRYNVWTPEATGCDRLQLQKCYLRCREPPCRGQTSSPGVETANRTRFLGIPVHGLIIEVVILWPRIGFIFFFI